jgi:hypothetical protein
VEKLIADDAEALAAYRDALVGKKHVHTDADNVSIKPKHGNSLTYTLDRLKRERPALFKRVVAGELSANAAAIAAGWRVKPTPLDRVLKLLPQLTPAERQQARSRLAELAGSRSRAVLDARADRARSCCNLPRGIHSAPLAARFSCLWGGQLLSGCWRSWRVLIVQLLNNYEGRH